MFHAQINSSQIKFHFRQKDVHSKPKTKNANLKCSYKVYTKNLCTVYRLRLLVDFQTSFSARLIKKFATKWALRIPPCL